MCIKNFDLLAATNTQDLDHKTSVVEFKNVTNELVEIKVVNKAVNDEINVYHTLYDVV